MDTNMKPTANGHELTRRKVRRGVAFRVSARTGVDAVNSWYGIAL